MDRLRTVVTRLAVQQLVGFPGLSRAQIPQAIMRPAKGASTAAGHDAFPHVNVRALFHRVKKCPTPGNKGVSPCCRRGWRSLVGVS